MEENETPIEENNIALPESEEGEGMQDHVEPDNVPESTDNTVDKEIEKRARLQGWRPEDEYKGKGEWVDADTFVQGAENDLRKARGTNRVLERKLDDMHSSFESKFERLKKFTDLQIQSAKDQAIKDLKDQQTKAIDEDGVDARTAIDKFERDKLSIEKQYTPDPETPKVNTASQRSAEVEQWIERNPWAEADKSLNAAALAWEHEIRADSPHLSRVQVLDKVKTVLIKEFPSKFNNPKRKVSSIEGGGTVHSVAKSKMRFSQLSLQDQNAANSMIRDGTFKSKEDFMNDYTAIYK